LIFKFPTHLSSLRPNFERPSSQAKPRQAKTSQDKPIQAKTIQDKQRQAQKTNNKSQEKPRQDEDLDIVFTFLTVRLIQPIRLERSIGNIYPIYIVLWAISNMDKSIYIKWLLEE
jgi:hypothetical protein